MKKLTKDEMQNILKNADAILPLAEQNCIREVRIFSNREIEGKEGKYTVPIILRVKFQYDENWTPNTARIFHTELIENLEEVLDIWGTVGELEDMMEVPTEYFLNNPFELYALENPIDVA